MSLMDMVNLGKSAMGVSACCRLFGLPRSSYYDQKKRTPKRKTRCRALVSQVQAVFEEHYGRYGSPRVHKQLRAQGIRISLKRVEAMMRKNGLIARQKRRFRPQTTDSNHSGPFAANLLKQKFHADAPDQVWVGDITYCKTSEGWLYLAVVLDVYSRRVVGWATSATLEATVAVKALEKAMELRHPAPGLIVHTDRGSQYASESYRKVLDKHLAFASMSRTGNCYDNAMAESFFSTLEFELRANLEGLTFEQVNFELAGYIEHYYNRKRMHSSLDYKSPVSYEMEQMAA